MIVALLALVLAAESPAVAEIRAERYDFLTHGGWQVRRPGRLAVVPEGLRFRYDDGLGQRDIPLTALRRALIQRQGVQGPGPLLLLESSPREARSFPEVDVFQIDAAGASGFEKAVAAAGLPLAAFEPAAAALQEYRRPYGWKELAGDLVGAAVAGPAGLVTGMAVNALRSGFWYPVPHAARADDRPRHPFHWLVGSWIVRRDGKIVGAVDCGWLDPQEVLSCLGSEHGGARPVWGAYVTCETGSCLMLRHGTREGIAIAAAEEGPEAKWSTPDGAFVERWSRRGGKRIAVETTVGDWRASSEWRRGEPEVRVRRTGGAPPEGHVLAPLVASLGSARARATVRWTATAPPFAFSRAERTCRLLDGGEAVTCYSWLVYDGHLRGVLPRVFLFSADPAGGLRLDLLEANGRRATLRGRIDGGLWRFEGRGREGAYEVDWRYEEAPWQGGRDAWLWSRDADGDWVLREAWTYAPPEVAAKK